MAQDGRQRLMERPTMDHDSWNDLVPSEVEFWDRWIESGGHDWPEDFKRRTDPQAPLLPQLVNFLPSLDLTKGAPIKVLDIGCGPLSFLGYKHPDYAIELTLVDPLADAYNAALDKANIEGVARPRCGYFETALADHGENSFDVVWCVNSLDHSIDPVIGLFNLLSLVRIGGGLVLGFHPNEADIADYDGLHQWNLDVRHDHFTLSQLDKTVDLHGLFSQQHIVKREMFGDPAQPKGRVTYFIKKTAQVNLSQALLR